VWEQPRLRFPSSAPSFEARGLELAAGHRRQRGKLELFTEDEMSTLRPEVTIELKSNHLGTVQEGAIACEATAQHLGRNTRVWDAVMHARRKARF
jgi:acyl-coenzyme A thioesterase PaaI-like protein